MTEITKNKSQFDPLKYTKLDDRILYIQLPEDIKYSYINVSFKIGFENDPVKFKGLAHLLEHMMFMGTTTYPDENEFSKMLAIYNGSHNAFTDFQETCYYFNCMNEGFDKMLDIFMHFFIDPIFSKEAIAREIQAVDSENTNLLNNNYMFMFNMFQKLSNKEYAYHSKLPGSIESLHKDGLQEAIVTFFKTHYIQENMTICIATNKHYNEYHDAILKYKNAINNNSASPRQLIKQPTLLFANSQWTISETIDEQLKYACFFTFNGPYQEEVKYLAFMLEDSTNEKNIANYLIHDKKWALEFQTECDTIGCDTNILMIFLTLSKTGLTEGVYGNDYNPHTTLPPLTHYLVSAIHSLITSPPTKLKAHIGYYMKVLNVQHEISIDNNVKNTQRYLTRIIDVMKCHTVEKLFAINKPTIDKLKEMETQFKLITVTIGKDVLQHNKTLNNNCTVDNHTSRKFYHGILPKIKKLSQINFLPKTDIHNMYSDKYPSYNIKNDEICTYQHGILFSVNYYVPTIKIRLHMYAENLTTVEEFVNMTLSINYINTYLSYMGFTNIWANSGLQFLMDIINNVIIIDITTPAHAMVIQNISLIINVLQSIPVKPLTIIADNIKEQSIEALNELQTGNCLNYAHWIVDMLKRTHPTDVNQHISLVNKWNYTNVFEKIKMNYIGVCGSINTDMLTKIATSFKMLIPAGIMKKPILNPSNEIKSYTERVKNSGDSAIIGISMAKKSNIQTLVMLQYIEYELHEKFFDILRTKEQLGYFVRLHCNIEADGYLEVYIMGPSKNKYKQKSIINFFKDNSISSEHLDSFKKTFESPFTSPQQKSNFYINSILSLRYYKYHKKAIEIIDNFNIVQEDKQGKECNKFVNCCQELYNTLIDNMKFISIAPNKI